MRRIFSGRLFAPVLFLQAVRESTFDFDRYGKSLDDSDGKEIAVSTANTKAKKRAALLFKREHKAPIHPAFTSEEYQQTIRALDQTAIPVLTIDDSWEFIGMITDRFGWIDEQIKKGMSPTDALEKMKLLMRIREIDKTCELNNAFDGFLDSPGIK